MRDRQTTLLWMRDLIEHLSQCHDQLQWADGTASEAFLTQSMLFDLIECRRLCEQLRNQPGRPVPTASGAQPRDETASRTGCWLEAAGARR